MERSSGLIKQGLTTGDQAVVEELAHALERHRLVAGLLDRGAGDDGAVVGQHHGRLLPDGLGQLGAEGVVDHAAVLVDQAVVAIQDGGVLVDHPHDADAARRVA